MGKWATRLSIGFLTTLAILSIAMIWIGHPNDINLNGVTNPTPPDIDHFLGTDDLGRDIGSRILDGARISLGVGLIAMTIAVSIGTVIGLFSGFMGGMTDELTMRVVDFIMGLPTLFIILIIQVILGPSLLNAMIVIGATSWMGIARLVRAEILSIRERPYILAARARGFSPWRIAIGHALPSALSPIIVSGILTMGGAILTESVLSFLGLGVQPPQASWGSMLQHSTDYLYTAPWMAISPGLAITLTVLSLNFIGDSLRCRANGNQS